MKTTRMAKYERFEGCILGEAIGDAYGSGFVNKTDREEHQGRLGKAYIHAAVMKKLKTQ